MVNQEKTAARGAQRIERVGPLTRQEFEDRYVGPKKPVIITGGITGWKALSTWTPEYFAEAMAEKRVDVSMHKADRKRGEAYPELKDITMKEAVDHICNNQDENLKYYLAQKPISQGYEELAGDYSPLAWMNDDTQYFGHLWFGQANTESKLHWDLAHNLFAQIYGRKHFHLYSPEENEFLYPVPPGSDLPPHLSLMNDVREPDLEKFPKFEQAHAYMNESLNPGEVLFMPAGWWHNVLALDVSISVNWWWKAKMSELTDPTHVMRGVPRALLAEGRFAAIGELFDLTDFENHLAVAKYFADNGRRWLAVYFSVAFLNDHLSAKAAELGIEHAPENGIDLAGLNQALRTKDSTAAADDADLARWTDDLGKAEKEDESLFTDDEIRSMIAGVESITRASTAVPA